MGKLATTSKATSLKLKKLPEKVNDSASAKSCVRSRKETESTKPHQDIDMHFNQEKDVDLGLEVYYKQIRIYTDILMWK